MENSRAIYRVVDLASGNVRELSPHAPSKIRVKEKRIEELLAQRPELLFSDPKAVKASQVSQWGYNLPVRATLCRIFNKPIADRIARQLRA